MKKVLASGTFNLVHPGHELFLRRARELGDWLVVVVASDRTVRERKPYLLAPAEDRAGKVRNLGIADRVTVGDENDWFRVVDQEKPDIIALGFDQDIDEEWLRKGLEKCGVSCRVVRIRESLPGHSTGRIIKENKNSK